MCAKKNALTPQEVEAIINDYLGALKLVRGEAVMSCTHLSYRKGWFMLRSAGLSLDAPATPYRAQEIQTMTAELLKQIPQKKE